VDPFAFQPVIVLQRSAPISAAQLSPFLVISFSTGPADTSSHSSVNWARALVRGQRLVATGTYNASSAWTEHTNCTGFCQVARPFGLPGWERGRPAYRVRSVRRDTAGALRCAVPAASSRSSQSINRPIDQVPILGRSLFFAGRVPVSTPHRRVTGLPPPDSPGA